MVIILVRAISWFAHILSLALVIRALLSWFAGDPYSSLGRAYAVMIKITEPVVEPCRRLLARLNINTGMLDFSVLIAMFMIEIVSNVLIRIILMFAI